MNELSNADILIVDDAPENLHLLARMLKEANYKVRALPNGTLALKSVEAHPPDLILLDIGMPDMNGYEVCKRLKMMKTAKKIPVLFISGYSEEVDIIRGFEAGGVDYITKPFKNLEVYARIKTHLSLRKKEVELEELLSKTLMGSIKAILDILAFIDPKLYTKSNRVARWMKYMVNELDLDEPWVYEAAALLSHLGTFAYSGHVLDELRKSSEVVEVSNEMIQEQRHVAVDIISNIPRMSTVARIIADEKSYIRKDLKTKSFEFLSPVRKGQVLLEILNSFDQLIQKSRFYDQVKDELFSQFPDYEDLIIMLVKMIEAEESNEADIIDIKALREGMILQEDIKSYTGVKLIGKGTQISQNLLEVLKNYAKHESICEPIRIIKNDSYI